MTRDENGLNSESYYSSECVVSECDYGDERVIPDNQTEFLFCSFHVIHSSCN